MCDAVWGAGKFYCAAQYLFSWAYGKENGIVSSMISSTLRDIIFSVIQASAVEIPSNVINYYVCKKIINLNKEGDKGDNNLCGTALKVYNLFIKLDAFSSKLLGIRTLKEFRVQNVHDYSIVEEIRLLFLENSLRIGSQLSISYALNNVLLRVGIRPLYLNISTLDKLVAFCMSISHFTEKKSGQA